MINMTRPKTPCLPSVWEMYFVFAGLAHVRVTVAASVVAWCFLVECMREWLWQLLLLHHTLLLQQYISSHVAPWPLLYM